MTLQVREILEARIETIVREHVAEATTLRELWLIYNAAAVPRELEATARQECRRAFYSGAMAVLEMLIRIKLRDGGLTIARVDALRQELVQFAADIANGRA
jgi:hypothetical protein